MYPTPTQSPYGFDQPSRRYSQEDGLQAAFLQRVLANFGATLLVAAAGAFFGWSLPPAYYMGLMLIQLVLILAVVFTRSRAGVSPFLLYAFAACTGATTVPIIHWAIHVTGGTAVVYNALAVTGAMFCGMAWFGYLSRRDLSGWSTFLWMGLIGALVTSLVGMFVTLSTPTQLLLSGVIVIVFAGFTAYDINRIKNNWRAYDVNGATLELYLDFVNLFVNVLRILAIIGAGGNSRD